MVGLTKKPTYLLHILLVGPMLIYVGHKKNSLDERIFKLIFFFFIGVILFHGYNLVKISSDSNDEGNVNGTENFINSLNLDELKIPLPTIKGNEKIV